jgi:hypothetical protein
LYGGAGAVYTWLYGGGGGKVLFPDIFVVYIMFWSEMEKAILY